METCRSSEASGINGMKATARKRLVQEYYSRRAKDYDSQKMRTWKSKQGFGDELLSRLINSIAQLTDKPVLEICVGTGRTSLPLLKKIKPWLVGLDLSREMLNVAKTKMSPQKERITLIMGDAEHLPFRNEAFDALICTSAMHYFVHPRRLLTEFSRTLRKTGVFIHGDLTLHELDDRDFLNRLEKTVSLAHGNYHKPSEIKKMLCDNGFQVTFSNTVAYDKPINYLIENKAIYFGVESEAVSKCVKAASPNERKLYSLSSDGLILFYTVTEAVKKDKP